MPDCEHPSPSGCYTCLSDRQLLALTAEYLCTILETGIPSGPPVGTQDVNVVSSVTLTVQGDTGRTWTLDFASDQVDVTGSTVIATGSLGRTWDLDFLTDQVDVSGSLVSVSNFPASFGVTQITSPWVVSGTVSVSNFPATQPVSGTVTANQGTSAVLPWRVQPAPDNLTVVETTVTASGDTTVYTPAAGNAIRLFWVYAVNDPDQLTTPLIRIKIGASAKYRAFAVAKAQVFEGAANEQLVVELGSAGSVAFTAHIQEFTP